MADGQRAAAGGQTSSLAADNRQLTADELPLNLFPIDRDFRRGDNSKLDAATVGVQPTTWMPPPMTMLSPGLH